MAGEESRLARLFLAEARGELSDCQRRIHHCLNQLDGAQLWWRPNEAANSIANLLLHLTGNINQRIVSIIGGAPDARDRQREFAERGPIEKKDLAARFDEAVARADAVLATLSGVQLLEARHYRKLSGEIEGNVTRLIVQTLVHLGGHTQEIIALARRQLGDRYRFMHSN